MGLLNCPDCNKINKASRNECWACSSALIKRRNPDEEWAGGTYAYRRNPLGMIPIPKNVGTDLAKQLFFKNPKGETGMRSMKRYNRNPRNWGSYLNRQNPDLGESLFTTLYKRRKLQRRNPQPATWSHQDIRSSGPATTGFKQPLFRRNRNPEGQAPVWGAPSWGGGSAAWGRTLFRNPQAATWSHQDIRSSGPATTGFKQPLFRKKNPIWGNVVGNRVVWGTRTRNPQPATWSHQDIRSSGPATTGFKQPLFRRNRNPGRQAPVWGAPSWGGGSAAWGRTLFRNPQAATWSHQDIRSSGPATTGFKQPLFRNPDDLDLGGPDMDDEDRDDRPISDIIEDNWQENPRRSRFRNPDPEFDGMVDHEDTFENQVLDDDFDLNDHLDAPKRYRRN